MLVHWKTVLLSWQYYPKQQYRISAVLTKPNGSLNRNVWNFKGLRTDKNNLEIEEFGRFTSQLENIIKVQESKQCGAGFGTDIETNGVRLSPEILTSVAK